MGVWIKLNGKKVAQYFVILVARVKNTNLGKRGKYTVSCVSDMVMYVYYIRNVRICQVKKIFYTT